MKNKVKDIIWIPIGVVSFFIFSSQFFPLLNSDDAINILMIKDLSLPQDLYAWGQDRGGSLIPILGWPMHHLLGISVVLSESIIHYFFLFIGFWSLSRYISSGLNRIIFAIAWFFPPYWFFSLVRFPFGVQYSLTALALICLIPPKSSFINEKKLHNRILAAIILLTISFWVSDLTITSIVAIILITSLNIQWKDISISSILKKRGSYFIIIIFSLSIYFILYAKNHASDVYNYNHDILNNFRQLGDSLKIVFLSFWQIITFKSETIIFSIYCNLSLFLIIMILIIKSISKKNRVIIRFLLIDGIFLFIIIVLSHWAFLNGVSRRYFTGIYIGITVLILILIDRKNENRKTFLQQIALATVIIGAISSIHYLKFIYPRSLKPMINVVGEFKSLGDIGVISEYWNSYITACPDPYKITAIPHDSSYNRNPALVDQVLNKPKLFVIKDMWFEKFPDTMNQYGYQLKRIGESFMIGNCCTNEYEIILKKKIFNLQNLKTINSQIRIDSDSSLIIYADSTCQECKKTHLVYGPDIELKSGQYNIAFSIRFDEPKDGKDLAIIDVTADYGKTQLAKKIINTKDVKQGSFRYYNLDFNSTKENKNVEFRIFFLGNCKIFFNHLILTGQ